MNVHHEILEWSLSIPAWQRDALRRLIEADSLTDQDIEELAELCKDKHGIEKTLTSTQPSPLRGEHLPQKNHNDGHIILKSLTHIASVNALIPGEILQFHSDGLTIIYGNNGAGKSGYARVLKSGCRARGSVVIHPNLLFDGIPGIPEAKFEYVYMSQDRSHLWKEGQPSPPEMSDINVFDSSAASVYLKEKTDVAFRPFGLDLFDKLADACEKVRKKLDREKNLLEKSIPLPHLENTTGASKFVSRLTGRTTKEEVMAACTLSQEEISDIATLEKRIKELTDTDPKAIAKELFERSKVIKSLHGELDSILSIFSEPTLINLKKSQNDLDALKILDANAAKEADQMLIPGVGNERWFTLLNAARDVSEKDVYKSNEFPNINADARCLLCHQAIRNEAKVVFEFIKKQIHSENRKQRDRLEAIIKNYTAKIRNVDLSRSHLAITLRELEKEDLSLANAINSSLAEIKVYIDQFKNNDNVTEIQFVKFPDLSALDSIRKDLEDRSNLLIENVNNASETESLKSKLRELRAKSVLSQAREAVLMEIERMSKISAYNSALQDTNSRQITLKSSEITQKTVTERLKDAFSKEINKIEFASAELELQAAGGGRGAFYHQVKFRRNPNVSVQEVLSEGEARALSIAAFFSELATENKKSGIIFDDPVSSLDHVWRDNVASRLVEEAAQRQVIVFTHDMVFMMRLVEIASKRGVNCFNQHVMRLPKGAGKCGKEMPWITLKTKDRISYLKNELPNARKIFNAEGQDKYASTGAHLFGLLREAWERAVEEVLLKQVVERFKKGIETKLVRYLVDITQEDYDTLDIGMSACSDWLDGHDQSPAINSPVPSPDKLGQEIERLDTWVSSINKRRNGK